MTSFSKYWAVADVILAMHKCV